MLFRLSFLGCLLVLCPAARGQEPFRFPEGKHGKGELKYRNDLPVLIVQGTPEEMGEQIGVLAVKPAAAKMKALVKDAVQKRVGRVGWPLLVKTCTALFEKFPEELWPLMGEKRAIAADWTPGS